MEREEEIKFTRIVWVTFSKSVDLEISLGFHNVHTH
jgi:hypothetical protein